MRVPYTVGAMMRTNFRRELQKAGIKYTEDKGWLDSQFMVEASPAQHHVIYEAFKAWKYRNEFEVYSYKIKKGDHSNDFRKQLEILSLTYEEHQGWFNTKFEVRCHPNDKDILDRAAKK